MNSRMRKAFGLTASSLILLSFHLSSAPREETESAEVPVSLTDQNQPSPTAPLYDVRLVRLADASISGTKESPLSGLILEIKNREPEQRLIIDTASVKITTADGKQLTPKLLFVAGIPEGKVNTLARDTKMVEKEIVVGDTTYKTLKSTTNIAVKWDSEGRVSFTFAGKSALQLGLIFAVDKKNISRLDFLNKAIDISPAN